MKTLTLLFGIAVCLAVVGPSRAEPSAEHEHHKQLRHRPKRQFLSDYGYQNPWLRPQYEPRRDDRYQQDQIANIYRVLQELTDLVRRPPPPPQPIYIPYPVQYPVPQYCNCRGPNRSPNITNRFPEMEDVNQNWGYDESQVEQEDYSQNARPINLDPIRPSGATSRPPPTVDHGSSQVGSDSTNSPRRVSLPASKIPKRCDAVVLSCCNPQETRQQQHACFTSSGCASYFESNNVCSSDHVQEVLELFVSSYSPVN